MKAIEHPIKHQYQPTISTCGQTALSILLGYYEDNITPQDIESQVPQVKNSLGQDIGTITQHMATWCISKGYKVSIHTFDCQVIDQSWEKLKLKDVAERLNLRQDGWVVPSLGKEWTREYAKSYMEFIGAGGELNIRQAVTTKMLNRLLESGPILPCVSFSTLHGDSRSRRIDNNEGVDDDINGVALNHFVVIYGVQKDGKYLIADPWKKPGQHIIEPELLLAAISTAQIECDNLLFQIRN